MARAETAVIGRRGFLGLAAAVAASAAVPRAAGASRRGGVLKHIGAEPSTFDVHGAPGFEALCLSSFVRRTLFKLASGARSAPGDFALVPDLAVRAELSPDGRRCTIALRRGVRWQSRPPVFGRELVAADVQYSLERALRTAPQGGQLRPVEAIEVVDRHTVRVHLTQRFAPLLHHLAEPCHAILPREVEERLGDFRSPESLVGCGPFALERYEPGIKAVLARNPTYYQPGLPYLDKVEWLFVRDRATQLSLFRAGQVDVPAHDGRIPRASVAALRRSNPHLPVVFWDGLDARALALRADRPPFNDARVRRALSLAVDRRKWVAERFDGQGDADGGPVPAALRDWRLSASALGDGARYLGHDPALAAKLLAEAGVAGGLKVRCAYWPGHGAECAEDLDRLAGELRAIGVELAVVADEAGHGRAPSTRHEEASFAPVPPAADVDGYLYDLYRTGQPGNRSHVADAALDALLDAQRGEAARPARKALVDQIQRHAAQQVYYLYAPRAKNVSSWAPWVRNYAPRQSLDRGAQLEVAWIERG